MTGGGPSDGEEDTGQHELVIIRRRNGDDDAPHKGGVWKIAHADFMTALMAFFLVMWLITATDEKTVTGIANYFNPMRLSDSTTRPKGVFTMEPGGERDGSEQGAPAQAKRERTRPGKTAEDHKVSEEALFSDPYEALDKIAAEVGKQSPQLPATERATTPGHRTGEAFRDPFDPDLRHGLARPGQGGAEHGENAGIKVRTDSDSGERGDPSGEQAREQNVAERQASAELTRQIEAAIRQSGVTAAPGIEVRPTKDGLLISITDQAEFEMFGIASARPKPELVVLMDEIGKLLLERPEHLVVRGHTDARPFRSDDYDNWRLSTARAQMANYMLMRSGIPEERIDRIEGHADHDLKVPHDPLAAQNRRIEILLVKEKP